MTSATDSELLRLAQKAWATREVRICCECDYWFVEDVGSGVLLFHDDPDRFHAALLVLAGEVDLQALLDAHSAPA